MSAIITDQIRILNAKNFVAGVSTNTNSYYAFVGLPNPTGIRTDWDSAPPAPVDSFSDSNDYWDSMIAVKKITPADVKQIVKKKKKIKRFRTRPSAHTFSNLASTRFRENLTRNDR